MYFHFAFQVQETASYFTIGFNLCNAVPSIIICLFLGVWSDISGRKIIIGLSLFGSILEYVTVIVTMYTDWPIYVIFAGSFLNGLGGYYIGIQFAVMAYIADTSDKDKRAVRLGKLVTSTFEHLFLFHDSLSLQSYSCDDQAYISYLVYSHLQHRKCYKCTNNTTSS